MNRDWIDKDFYAILGVANEATAIRVRQLNSAGCGSAAMTAG